MEHTQWMGVPFVMLISTMSSSEIEEASIGVPSLLVIDIKHNLPRNISADGTS